MNIIALALLVPVMSELLQPIIQGYQQQLEQLDGNSQEGARIRHLLTSLKLAQAVERKRLLIQSHPHHPPQLAVIGPTQAGKSTLVNLLLGLAGDSQENEPKAIPSARAGYTVHCQGFACAGSSREWLDEFFSRFVKQDQSSLKRELVNEYACSDVSEQLSDDIRQQFADTVVWDTPDFDSVASTGYLNPLLQTIALADLVLMVVSKEKYADKSVWDMLALLGLLGKPVTLVMNKTAPVVRDELAASVETKFSLLFKKQRQLTQTPAIYFVDEVLDPQRGLAESEDIVELRRVINSQLRRSDEQVLDAGLKNLVNSYWQQWTLPAVEQLEQQQTYETSVESSADDLINRYKSEFLENSRHKETFQLAIAELLLLLEVPGVAAPLSKIRSVVTWPVRKMLGVATQTQSPAAAVEDNRTDERRLLEALFDHQLTQLQAYVARQSETESAQQQWWQQRAKKLRLQTQSIEKGYNNELDNYQTLLKVEAERAARSLYTKLEEQPALLNSLRAARVSADAAAVVLAVKSGGLGAVDLVIAPAMLSLTTMLTESALGQYMQTVQQDLKNYQEKTVSSLVRRKYSMKLKAIGGSSTTQMSKPELDELAQHYGIDNVEVTHD